MPIIRWSTGSAPSRLWLICSRLGVAWDPELQVSTISGLVTEMLERIPVAGDTIEWNGFHVEVVKADRRRARLLSIRRQ